MRAISAFTRAGGSNLPRAGIGGVPAIMASARSQSDGMAWNAETARRAGRGIAHQWASGGRSLAIPFAREREVPMKLSLGGFRSTVPSGAECPACSRTTSKDSRLFHGFFSLIHLCSDQRITTVSSRSLPAGGKDGYAHGERSIAHSRCAVPPSASRRQSHVYGVRCGAGDQSYGHEPVEWFEPAIRFSQMDFPGATNRDLREVSFGGSL
jgi:hypothetical protein